MSTVAESEMMLRRADDVELVRRVAVALRIAARARVAHQRGRTLADDGRVVDGDVPDRLAQRQVRQRRPPAAPRPRPATSPNRNAPWPTGRDGSAGWARRGRWRAAGVLGVDVGAGRIERERFHCHDFRRQLLCGQSPVGGRVAREAQCRNETIAVIRANAGLPVREGRRSSVPERHPRGPGIGLGGVSPVFSSP